MNKNVKVLCAALVGLAAVVTLLAFSLGVSLASATPNTFEYGDLLIAVGGGLVYRYNPDGDGAIQQILDTTSGSVHMNELCWDENYNLYATNANTGDMSRFDSDGILTAYPWAGPFSTIPGTCVGDMNGHIYVGEGAGDNYLRRFDLDGSNLVTYAPVVENEGIGGMDLASDLCTMYYTSREDSVQAYDVCTSTQLPDLVTGLNGPCHALRIRDNGEIIVACDTEILRLDNLGNTLDTYQPGADEYFALELDPDGTSFWTAGVFSGEVYRVDMESGDLLHNFTAQMLSNKLKGITIYTGGEPGPTPTTSYTSVDVSSFGSSNAAGNSALWLAVAFILLVAGVAVAAVSLYRR